MQISIKRNGGLWFWRLGRLGGSLYRAKLDHTRYRRSAWLYIGVPTSTALAGRPWEDCQ